MYTQDNELTNNETEIKNRKKYSQLLKEAEKIADYYDKLSQKAYAQNDLKKSEIYKKKAFKVRECGRNAVRFTGIKDGVLIDRTYKMFCDNRQCPVCIAKKAKKNFKLVLDIVNHPATKNCGYVFMTLTLRNCRGDELSDNISKLLDAFHSLNSNKNSYFRKRFLGTFKVLECTHNKETNMYHPHLHVLAMVDKDLIEDYKYLESNPESNPQNDDKIKYVVTKEELTRKWQHALKVDYIPQVDIETTYNATANCVAEVSKYTVKSMEIDAPIVLETYDTAFAHRKLRVFTGLFRDVKLLVEAEWEKEKEDGISYSEIKSNDAFIKCFYRWNYFHNAFILKDISVSTKILIRETEKQKDNISVEQYEALQSVINNRMGMASSS